MMSEAEWTQAERENPLHRAGIYLVAFMQGKNEPFIWLVFKLSPGFRKTLSLPNEHWPPIVVHEYRLCWFTLDGNPAPMNYTRLVRCFRVSPLL
jgi:hypothetical protein